MTVPSSRLDAYRSKSGVEREAVLGWDRGTSRFSRDPEVGQGHCGDRLVAEPEPFGRGEPAGRLAEPDGPLDRVEGVEPLADAPAVASGLGLARVGPDQVPVRLGEVPLRLARPAGRCGRPRRETTAIEDRQRRRQGVQPRRAAGFRLHHRQSRS